MGTGPARGRCRRDLERARSRSKRFFTLELELTVLLARSARRPDRPRQLLLTDAHHRIDAKRAPRCGELAAGVDPPNCLASGRRLTNATLRANHCPAR